MSLVTLAIFARDKAAAGKDKRRVPERTLMAWMVCGGAPGGLAGIAFLRHKTRKPSFATVGVAASLLWAVACWAASGL